MKITALTLLTLLINIDTWAQNKTDYEFISSRGTGSRGDEELSIAYAMIDSEKSASLKCSELGWRRAVKSGSFKTACWDEYVPYASWLVCSATARFRCE